MILDHHFEGISQAEWNNKEYFRSLSDWILSMTIDYPTRLGPRQHSDGSRVVTVGLLAFGESHCESPWVPEVTAPLKDLKGTLGNTAWKDYVVSTSEYMHTYLAYSKKCLMDCEKAFIHQPAKIWGSNLKDNWTSFFSSSITFKQCCTSGG